jgi:hypothetical protein
VKEYQREKLILKHPLDWTIEEAEEGDGWTTTIQSPGSAFILVSLRPEAEDAAQLADETLGILKDDYPELDHEDRVEKLAGLMAIGHDIDLIALDTSVVCQTRSLESPDGPMVILWQCAEPDLKEFEPQLKMILMSVHFEDE